MDPILVGVITLIALLIFITLGLHLSVSLMMASILGIFLSTGNINTAIKILGTTAFSSIRDYIFGVIPLFMLMGLLANLSGASNELYNAANALLKKVRGGLCIATVIANAIFAAITGVSVASAAVFTKIAVPQMTRLGYDKKLAVGCVAGSSILGMLIPPSILMIVYGTLAEASIGKLFIAGVVPGIVMSLAFILTILILVKRKPDLVKDMPTESDNESIVKTILKPWAIGALIIVSLGGIWAGFFTPTEAGGVGAFGGVLLVIGKGKFKVKDVWNTLLSTGITTGSILILLISAQTYSRALAISGFVNVIEDMIKGLDVPNMVIILVFMVILIILGCLLDSTSILLLTMPIMVPVVKSFGMDLVWFGIVAIVAIETGLLTPPFGMSVFTVKSSMNELESSIGKVSVEDVFKGSMPFLYAMFAVLVVLIFVPSLSTYLVSLM